MTFFPTYFVLLKIRDQKLYFSYCTKLFTWEYLSVDKENKVYIIEKKSVLFLNWQFFATW